MEKKRLTLKDIEEHLRRQDRRAFVPVLVFGGSILLMALGLLIQKMSGLDFYLLYVLLMLFGCAVSLYALFRLGKK